MAHAHHPVGQPLAVNLSELLPTILFQPPVELLEVILRQLVQRDVSQLRIDVQAYAAPVGVLGGGADLGLSVVLEPVLHPVTEAHVWFYFV